MRTMGERGRQFAGGFTWDRAARETERHLREIAGVEAERELPFAAVHRSLRARLYTV